MEASNIKAMRDALEETQSVIEKCMEILNRIPDGVEYDGLIDDVADELCDLRDSHVNPVIDATPRNCDVGTVEEQDARHSKWCRRYGIDGDMEVACAHQDMSCTLCALRWAQMPYEEGGAK